MVPSLLVAALLSAPFHGLVVDPGGKPIAAATVQLFPSALVDGPQKLGFDAKGKPLSEPSATATTDKKGLFTLELPEGDPRPLLLTRAAGFGPHFLRPEPPAAPAVEPPTPKGKKKPKRKAPARPAPVRIELAPGASLEVMPRCGDDPCTGAVELWVTVGPDARQTKSEAHADKVPFPDLGQGDAELTASVARGTPDEMIAYAKVPLGAGEAQTVALVLEPLDPCAVTGRVTDPRGQPVQAGVRAECGGLRRSSTSDAAGLFTLGGLPKGRCTVFAELPNELDPSRPRKVFAQLNCPAKDVALILR